MQFLFNVIGQHFQAVGVARFVVNQGQGVQSAHQFGRRIAAQLFCVCHDLDRLPGCFFDSAGVLQSQDCCPRVRKVVPQSPIADDIALDAKGKSQLSDATSFTNCNF